MNQFSEIYLNTFYIGDQIITIIKDTNHVQVVNVSR